MNLQHKWAHSVCSLFATSADAVAGAGILIAISAETLAAIG